MSLTSKQTLASRPPSSSMQIPDEFTTNFNFRSSTNAELHARCIANESCSEDDRHICLSIGEDLRARANIFPGIPLPQICTFSINPCVNGLVDALTLANLDSFKVNFSVISRGAIVIEGHF